MTKAEMATLKEMISDVLKDTKVSSVANCNFVGVQYDAKAVFTIETIAAGLVENAKALGALAQVLKASNVTIGAMMKL